MTVATAPDGGRRSVPRTLARLLLGLVLVTAGTAHLTLARQAFQAQVPPWLPVDPDVVVVASGFVEIALGLALVLLARWRVVIGIAVAAFFIAVFPGNVSQLVTRTPAFGLETDTARAVRLVFQPLLVVWALWSTGAFSAWRARRSRAERG
ncbi:hypothetical protein C5C00_12495 [Rathayibacter rathayi]|uniref:DoxX family protein n=1 Tax=Rathayibacter rathayi TaxID=33887 RepID=UPI000CE76519|nr:hypothetical protein [Rathayibacter rathayi]PPG88315.1 hypothetical protein C5C47_07990 [Rathayibacter rathayi]PPG94179.1 hypothetical protein C5C00_12495 [Rathayibacter rathayi]